MSERHDVLGFEPQKETPYNKLLPYSNRLDEEALTQLALIKANLARTIQLRDIKFGASHWTGQLAKYIRLHGLTFSKEDHICFIKLLYELTTIPDLSYSLVQKFAQLLINLLKKRDLLSRDELTLPWQPLHKMLVEVVYSHYEYHGLVLFPSQIEAVLKHLVRVCRIYFPLEATQEMLVEWRPLLCPFDMTMLRGMYFFELFLPTTLPPEHHDQGFKLWFEELMGLYLGCQNCPSWEGNLVNLFSRLASDTIGYVDWDPYVDQIFTRILRSFSLPVGDTKIHVMSGNNTYDVSSIVWWISSMLGGGSSCQENLQKLFNALESFYHPSNVGRWNSKLLKFMCKLPQSVTKRIHRERYKVTWLPAIRDTHRLTNEEITTFVQSMKPIVLLSMFSKFGSHDSAAAIKQLAVLRPEIIIPPLLDRTYPALETLTEPHRLVACLQCLVAVGRPMLGNHTWFPEGRSHVIPLLNHCLPGIDQNDIRKSLTTFQLISTIVSLIPLVDCSEALTCRTDLTEEERVLCAASTQLEDFVLQFIDRVFGLIENSSHEHMRTDSSAAVRLTHEETMMEVGLLSTFNAVVQQSSDKIYREILNRVFKFVSTSVYEVAVAGRYTGDLVRAAVKVHPVEALKKFMTHFCDIIIARTTNEDLSKEEHLDNEFLWNLNLLSECVRCDGKAILPYVGELKKVLSATLHLKCKEAANIAGNLLRHMLKAFTLTYPTDYRSSQNNWNAPLSENLPIRDWGISGDVNTLELKWHVPSEEERSVTMDLLQHFLLPELSSIDKHVALDITLDREDLQRSLTVLLHCLVGAGVMMPPLQGDPITLVDCLVEMKRFDHIAALSDMIINLNGENVRNLVVKSLRPLVNHMLTNTEDDTKSLNSLVKVYRCLLFFQGTQKEDFDARWKSLHIVKKSMENKLQGKKKHIRALLVDRVQLQHELRVVNHSAKVFTSTHKEIFEDLFKLATSRYIEVRQQSQQALNQGFYLYAYSYKVMLDDIIVLLKDDPAIEDHQYKGALYLLYGENKRSLVYKRSWDAMRRVWPALIQAKHSEKPSLAKLTDDLADKLHKNIETTELSIKVHPALLETAGKVWTSVSKPHPALPSATDEELLLGQQQELLRNQEYLQGYTQLVDELVKIIDSAELHWKFHLMGLEMLGLLLRNDVTFPSHAVRLFTKNIINEHIQVRKIAIMTSSATLKVQKQKHPMIEIDPYSLGGVEPPDPSKPCQSGNRPDNTWHHYNNKLYPWPSEDMEKQILVEKTHWGYYNWPKPAKVYAKCQPSVDRKLEDLRDEEKPIYEHFMDEEFVKKLIRFLSLEGNKEKDKFHSKYFVFFKGLFRNFGDTFFPLIKPHIERLVSDTSPQTHESNHRCASEIVAGMLRGYKHWPLKKVEALWEWLTPVLKTALTNVTVETVRDWGTCFATSSENRDPRMLAPMLELLMDSPLRGDGGSFADSSRLYMLQGAIAQQEWRIPEILHRLLQYSLKHMAHPYKNVRDRLGSVLVNVFLYDIDLPHAVPTTSPKKAEFINQVLPQMEILVKSQPNSKPECEAMETEAVSASQGASTTDIKLVDMAANKSGATNETENGESEERKTAVRLFKTVMKWLQGNFSRMFQCVSPEIFKFLPLICAQHNLSGDEEVYVAAEETLESLSMALISSEHVEHILHNITQICQMKSELTDEELRHDCNISAAFLSKVLLSADVIPIVLDTVKMVACMSQWHARAAILSYLQVMVYNNLYLVQDTKVKQQLQDIVIELLCDEQLEVRELAAMTLGGFLQCGYMTLNERMKSHFEQLSSTKIKKKRRAQLIAPEMIKPELLIRRHAGVLGLSACVQAYPYDVPGFIPQILMDLSDHLDDPQPIQMTVKKTLSNFKRTHHDNWHDHKLKFTDDQLVVLTELLVSPNYYA